MTVLTSPSEDVVADASVGDFDDGLSAASLFICLSSSMASTMGSLSSDLGSKISSALGGELL